MEDHLLQQDETLKVLGISWLPHDDMFRFQVNASFTVTPTKRSVLSVIARLYDPLGWAAPVVIVAKILLQELWLTQSDWDTPLPDELRQQWEAYYNNLKTLNGIRIPRWTGRRDNDVAFELHGFADASNRAYAAVYIRILHMQADVQVCLLAAKTKVAPLKTLSIPRLELNAIVLLSRLIKWVQMTLSTPSASVFGWSDSAVALAWLRQHPAKWQTFVADHVSEVQRTLPEARWNHVSSKDNPADCASRGLSAEELFSHPLWWTGPRWLARSSTSWPTDDHSLSLDSSTNPQVYDEALTSSSTLKVRTSGN
ncbi:PREDICTED: uncharacterized protein LOC108762506 [Trachymyrmex cornetzi]|uniref:uncharacterized protein LOC108762506 n=1 Tax=Trachymyrmex cornetzi TaxID=471704 RepID=UPI00084EE8F7|nr:PREDICTED: uncharacterized protein LOC108762506 [Trachymyrmex cornetzi]